MRIFVKDQIVELIPTICEGINYAKTANENEANIIFADCNEAINSIVASLKSGVSESCFENYYSLLVKTIEDSLNKLINGIDDNNKCIDGLNQIAELLNKEQEVKYEIVFLPYKASMWDSMESVWKASINDSRCDVYVIPIPYYERTSKGELKELIYEGSKFPKYVPIVHYDMYNFASRTPDIIYVHNPFDEYNLVTSVAPKFYSAELRKYTNKLVYIPYFAAGGELSKSFYNLPFYYNVDNIITQTEQTKEFYAKELESKLLPLGTPKFDAIMNLKIDKQEVKKIWNIEKYNKVFFYNTSISGLLQYREKMILKIQSVIDIFEKLDCALIWRPHPLMTSTIKSMLPGLLPYYETLLRRAHNAKNIVIDETPNANIAIKLSDAYIGESTSSIVHLFGIEGKPIYLTDLKISENYAPELENVQIFDVAKVDNDFWFTAGDRNCLCKCDNVGKILEIYEIPNEKKDGCRLYNSIIYKDGKLYLIPFNAKEIAVFDILNKTFKKIKFENSKDMNFSNGYIYKDSVYMVPVRYNAILELNTSANEITYHKEIVEDMIKLQTDKKELISYNGNLLDNNILYVAMSSNNHVFEMNLDTNEYKINKVGNIDDNYWCMAGKDGKFVLGVKTGNNLVLWNKNTNKTDYIIDFPEGWVGKDKCYYKMLCLGNSVFVFPKTANMVLKINLDDGSVKKESFNLSYEPNDRKNEFYDWPSNYLMATKLSEEEFAIQSAYSYGMEIINLNGEHKNIEIKISDEMLPYEWNVVFAKINNNIPWAVFETKECVLQRFVNYVLTKTHDIEKQIAIYSEVSNNIDGTAGEKIHNTILSRME